MKNRKYYTVGPISKYNRKIAEKEENSTPLLQSYMTDHFQVWYRHLKKYF